VTQTQDANGNTIILSNGNKITKVTRSTGKSKK